jgi:glycosyltransferase involved in cell wall biosynthesis
MTDGRCRVLIIASHPVQYASPLFRLLAKDARLEIQVAYCSLQASELHLDPDFGVHVKWDVPLLEDYPWLSVPNRSWMAHVNSFFGLFNPGIWRLICSGRFDTVVLLTSYVYATFWIAIAASKWNRVAVIFSTDAHSLTPRDRKGWRLWVKKWFWPHLFRLVDVVMVSSSGGVALMRSLGIQEDRVVLNPFCVNNEWWIQQSDRVNLAAVRARWDVPENASVVLFCAKLQDWKRPQDLLRAFARVATPDAYLVFAGEGALRQTLEFEANSLEIASRVRFLGFVNQSGLPETYAASDILVLPSEYEPFGAVVNEAMLCRCPVIVSDRVGARFDLIRNGETGFVVPLGNVEALASLLDEIIPARKKLKQMGTAARERMAGWSPQSAVESVVSAVQKAARIRQGYRKIM